MSRREGIIRRFPDQPGEPVHYLVGSDARDSRFQDQVGDERSQPHGKKTHQSGFPGTLKTEQTDCQHNPEPAPVPQRGHRLPERCPEICPQIFLYSEQNGCIYINKPCHIFSPVSLIGTVRKSIPSTQFLHTDFARHDL